MYCRHLVKARMHGNNNNNDIQRNHGMGAKNFTSYWFGYNNNIFIEG